MNNAVIVAGNGVGGGKEGMEGESDNGKNKHKKVK